ncbi:metalloregulator ArsR/SmtB family transcription factor [Nesterenkonia sp. HG001]|uniref:ArsR/SmtB family transcription factor n=1 Tax=Nesterenkonia sp. HG001 TaxID=2983207 RepID=UPI002AC6FB99|nr:metalloregulator ArsR/SmtB family transcription factor [Nesterenkonia sp. HG001]MDZ5079041.1 metalloregulator ArsR/SmtB family transcription factor [Nesterenkonia sp. HG001]
MSTTTPAEAACCLPTLQGPLTAEEAEPLAAVFKAVADPVRLRLLSIIEHTEDGEACVCDLTEPLDLSQPTVSHHLKILVDAGLLTRTKRGRWAYYAVQRPALDEFGALLRRQRAAAA